MSSETEWNKVTLELWIWLQANLSDRMGWDRIELERYQL